MRTHRWRILFSALCAMTTTGSPAPALPAGVTFSDTVPSRAIWEITIPESMQYANPFDPAVVRVDAEFTREGRSPIHMPGFYWHDYRSVPDHGRERLSPVGGAAWKVRFPVPGPGWWTFTVRQTVRDRAAWTVSGRFVATSPLSPGCVVRCPAAPTHFCREDGSAYVPIGENLAWSGAMGTRDFERWIPELAVAGGNWTRVWIDHAHFGIEWSGDAPAGSTEDPGYGGLGRYSLANAWRIDRLLTLAQRHRVGVMLTLLTAAELMDAPGYFHEEAWKQNPYAREMGGPCASPATFFTDSRARSLFKQRIRYLTARFGAYSSIQSWELFNEEDAPAAWVDEMARSVHTMDPGHHLVSTTYGSDRVWRLPSIDFTQSHTYGVDGQRTDSSGVIADLNQSVVGSYGKPHLVAEFGLDWKRSDRHYDPTGRGTNLHNGAWASLASCGSGTAMLWWWDDYVHPFGVYRQFGPIERFVRDLPWEEAPWFPLKMGAVEEAHAGGPLTDLVIPAQFGWGRPPGRAEYTVSSTGQIAGGPVVQYLYSMGKPDLRTIPAFHLRALAPCEFVVEVGEVMTAARIVVRVDGRPLASRELPTGPGKGPWVGSRFEPQWKTYSASYRLQIVVPVPAGSHTVTVENASGDWASVSGYRIKRYRSSKYPDLERYGTATRRSAVVWIHDRASNWRSDIARRSTRIWSGLVVPIGVPPGAYRAVWWNTWNGRVVRTDRIVSHTDGVRLHPPPFTRDIAVRVSRLRGRSG